MHLYSLKILATAIVAVDLAIKLEIYRQPEEDTKGDS